MPVTAADTKMVYRCDDRPYFWVTELALTFKSMEFQCSQCTHCFMLLSHISLCISVIIVLLVVVEALQWRHNERNGVSSHHPHDYLFNRSFRRRSKKTSKLRVPGLCVGNSSVTDDFPAQMASNTENVSIWWRHHTEWGVMASDLLRFKMKVLNCHTCSLQSNSWSYL